MLDLRRDAVCSIRRRFSNDPLGPITGPWLGREAEDPVRGKRAGRELQQSRAAFIGSDAKPSAGQCLALVVIGMIVTPVPVRPLLGFADVFVVVVLHVLVG